MLSRDTILSATKSSSKARGTGPTGSGPGHLTAIDASGAVRPRELRQVYNVLDDRSFERPVEIDKKAPRIATVDSTLRLDVLGNPLQDVSKNFIYDYIVRPGVSRVGSNPHLAPNILDDDPTTFWEPNPDDPIGDWWIEVHLGRVVPLERLRLQFVDEQLGDPFLKFLLFFEKKTVVLGAGRQQAQIFDFRAF